MDDQKELYLMHADFCKFMGNAKRIEILFLLGENERCVEDIAHKMDIPIANISQHLAILRRKGDRMKLGMNSMHSRTEYLLIEDPRRLAHILDHLNMKRTLLFTVAAFDTFRSHMRAGCVLST